MAKKKPTAAALAAALSVIVQATQSSAGFGYAQGDAIEQLEKDGLVECNRSDTNADGYAVRATAAGTEKYNATMNTNDNSGSAASSTDTTEGSGKFAIDTDVALPPRQRATPAGLYPFDQLQQGQSFHVPKSAEKPNPAKSLASTVASANEKHSEEIAGETRVNKKGRTVAATKQLRKFEVRPVGKDDPRGEGARVFRTL